MGKKGGAPHSSIMSEVLEAKSHQKMFVAEMVLESATTAMPGVHGEGGTHSFRKYSLRPRSSSTSASERKASKQKTSSGNKPRGKAANRREKVENKQKQVKQKSAILSKYRRKNANARERFRMKAINDGFEALRRVVPFQQPEHHQEAPTTTSDSNKKLSLTKITTLRLAIQYIRALTKLLDDHDAGRLDTSTSIEAQGLKDELMLDEICDWDLDGMAIDVGDDDKRVRDVLAASSTDTSSDASSSGFCSDDNNQIVDDFFDPFDPFSPFPSASDPGTLDALFSPSGGDFDLDDFYDP